MPTKTEVVLLPVLLNGMLYTIDNGGNMAITTDGRATPLYDVERSNSRFK